MPACERFISRTCLRTLPTSPWPSEVAVLSSAASRQQLLAPLTRCVTRLWTLGAQWSLMKRIWCD